MIHHEPEYVRAIYDAPAEHHVEDSSRFGEHPVFERAFEAQFGFLGTLIDENKSGPDGALDTYWKEHRAIAKDLSNESAEARLIDKPVKMSGDDMIIPKVMMDHATGITKTAPMSEQERVEIMLKRTLTQTHMSGKFSGFALMFKKTSDLTQDIFEPYIAYKVEVGRYISVDAETVVYATGDIRTTSLDFDADSEKDEKLLLINHLYTFRPQIHKEVAILKRCLEEPQYTHSVMHDIATIAHEIVETIDDKQLRQVIEDVIADLIKRYIGQHERYLAKAHVFTRSKGLVEGGGVELIVGVSQPYTFNKKVTDVVYMDEHPRMPEQATVKTNGRSLHVVYSDEQTGKHAFVPFSCLHEFTKM